MAGGVTRDGGAAVRAAGQRQATRSKADERYDKQADETRTGPEANAGWVRHGC